MYCYKFPNEFVHELNMVLARFWWGGNEDKKKIHCLHWDSLCTSKDLVLRTSKLSTLLF